MGIAPSEEINGDLPEQTVMAFSEVGDFYNPADLIPNKLTTTLTSKQPQIVRVVDGLSSRILSTFTGKTV